MKIAEEYEVKLPTWSLSSLINGDDSGLSNEDLTEAWDYIEQFYGKAHELGGLVVISIDTYQVDVDEMYRRFNESLFDGTDHEDLLAEFRAIIEASRDQDEWKESYFSSLPEFGLPCEVQDCHILILV